jgi:hypothetical protein
VTGDFNDDSYQDILLVGNDYGNEVFIGRYDACTGMLLLGDGKLGFNAVPSATSGFYVPGDAKALVSIRTPHGHAYIAAQNRDSVKTFTVNSDQKIVETAAEDTYAEITFQNGRKRRVELYYGSGYYSQSTRTLPVPSGATEVLIYNRSGKSRKIIADSRMLSQTSK